MHTYPITLPSEHAIDNPTKSSEMYSFNTRNFKNEAKLTSLVKCLLFILLPSGMAIRIKYLPNSSLTALSSSQVAYDCIKNLNILFFKVSQVNTAQRYAC